MADSPTRNPFASSVVLRVPGAQAVDVTRDRPWGGAGRFFDLYRPPDARGPLPAVVFVTGFADPGFRTIAGHALKDTAPFSSWARLLAASGLAAVTYSNEEPAVDAPAVLAYLCDNAAELGIDAGRFGLWACSGHAPTALAVLCRTPRLPIRCAALCYGYMLDLEGSTEVADQGRRFRFAVPAVTPDQIPADVPLLIARAGADATPGVNASIDRFARYAETRPLDVEIAQHPTGPHAFDVLEDSDTSRAVIRRIVGFLRDHLRP